MQSIRNPFNNMDVYSMVNTRQEIMSSSLMHEMNYYSINTPRVIMTQPITQQYNTCIFSDIFLVSDSLVIDSLVSDSLVIDSLVSDSLVIPPYNNPDYSILERSYFRFISYNYDIGFFYQCLIDLAANVKSRPLQQVDVPKSIIDFSLFSHKSPPVTIQLSQQIKTVDLGVDFTMIFAIQYVRDLVGNFTNPKFVA
jgi:hypothetical protein